jgi:hypothetical protein
MIYCLLSSVLMEIVFSADDIRVKYAPCHHSIARPQVADGKDGLQIWKVAVNILSSLGQPTMGGPPPWGWVLG